MHLFITSQDFQNHHPPHLRTKQVHAASIDARESKAPLSNSPYILASAQRVPILAEVLLGKAIDWQVVQVLK